MIHNTCRNPSRTGFPRKCRPAVVWLTALLVVGLAGAVTLAAQDAKLPDGEKIVDRFVEVTGGQAAYAKLNNRVIEGTFELPEQGIKAALKIYAARPAKMYSVLEAEMVGKVEKGTDGTVAWEKSLMSGPQIKEGEERTLMLRGAAFDAIPKWRELFKKAECVGVETVGDEPCYKVVLTATEGEPETRYYNQKSGLLAKTEAKLKLPMGTIPVESYPSDYKRIDGILMATKARVVVMGSERIVTSKSIEHNVDLPKDRFDLPEDIQALVKAKKSADEAEKPEKAEKADTEKP